MKKKWVAVIIGLAVLCLCYAAGAEVPAWTKMKDFKVETLDGETFELYKTLEEKELVLIDLWYIDCEPCAEAAAGIQGIYDEYKDRVGFISINAFDSVKDIELYTKSRGLTYPCAKNSIASSWTNMYPHFIMVKKDGTVLFSEGGLNTPERVRALLENGLNMSDEEIQTEIQLYEESGYGRSLYPYIDDWTNAVQAYLQCFVHVYNIKDNMALQVESPGLKKIVVDDNLNILQCNEMVGEFYIASSDEAQVTVTVKAKEGAISNKANVYDWNTFESSSFKTATKDNNDYTFEFNMDHEGKKQYTYFASETTYYVTRDSYVGLACFSSEEEAEQYFKQKEEEYGNEFPWHIYVPQGTCGENITWSLEDGVLTLTGEGEMTSAPWYRYCDEIVRVHVDEGITSIYDYAFQRCGNLEEINIPETVTRIGRYAFYKCESLQQIMLPDSVAELEDGAFSGCTSLTEVKLSGSLKELSRYLFEDCDSIRHLDIPDGVLHLQCESIPKKVESLNLPDSLQSFDRFTFGEFKNCEAIKTLRIPQSMKAILGSTLTNCPNLEKIDLPDGLLKIDNYAFPLSVESIYIPSSVYYIGRYNSMYVPSPDYTSRRKEVSIKCEKDSYVEKWQKIKQSDSASYSYEMNGKAENFVKTKGDFPNDIDPEVDGATGPYYWDRVFFWSDEINALDFEFLPVFHYNEYYYANLPDGTVAILGYTGKKNEIDLNGAIPGKIISSVSGDGFGDDWGDFEFDRQPLCGSIINPNGPIIHFPTKVILPDTIKCLKAYFGSPVVGYKYKLQQINIPKEAKYIEGCFGGSGNLTDIPLMSTELQKGAQVAFASNTAAKVNIPYGYVYIAERFLQYSEGTGTLELPSSLREIGNAFINCKYSTICIPESVEFIKDKAFYKYETDGCAATFNVVEGSYAEFWAKRMGYKTNIIVPVREISLSEMSAVLATGKQLQIKAETGPDDATNKKVTWTSSDPAVAEVSNNGTVKAKSVGECDVICSAADNNGASVRCHIKVFQPVQGLKLESDKITLMLGGDEALAMAQIVPIIVPEDAAYKDCIYVSSDESVATVDEKGTVRGIAPGKAKITITSAEPDSRAKAACTVTVGSLVTAIKLEETSGLLKRGGSVNLKPEIQPEKPTNAKLEWTSSNPEIATVSASGAVKAVVTGTAVITCTSTDGGNVSASYEVTVCVPVDKTVFKDPVFLQYVAENLDSDHDGLLTPEEAETVKVIDCKGDASDQSNAIKDLSGIENFPNLTELNVSWNRLTKLDLTQNMSIEKLNCTGNPLKNTDFSYLLNLNELIVDGGTENGD